MLKLLAALTTAIILSGCATAMSPPPGGLFMDNKGPIFATRGKIGSKVGKACISNIIGISTGDASLEAAIKAGDIRRISYVDSTAFGILGLYAEFCTVVHGR